MSENYAVRYTPQALDDLRDLYTYLAFTLQVPATARQLTARLRKSIRSLNQLPSRYPLVEWEPWNSRGLRKMPVEHFVVFYLVKPDPPQVTVIRILYGGRDIDQILSRTSTT